MPKFKSEFAASNLSTENTNIIKRLSLFQYNQRNKWVAFSILFAGLILTLAGSLLLKSETEREAKTELDFVGNELKNKIVARLHTHAQLLRSGAAFFSHSDFISRKEWRDFIATQKIERNVPGIQGVGYSVIISPDQLRNHEKEVQQEGFPQYSVKPSGKREIYTSIIFLEPFSGRNLRAFGYDMYSEPIRRAAMEKARDYDIESLSQKITLVQETNEDVQAGTLMYVPVYRRGMPAATVEERRKAILGWVYSPYRMNDLMQGILGGYETIRDKNIRMEIFDNPSFTGDALLYDSWNVLKTDSRHMPLFSQKISVTFNGKVWYLRFTKDDPDGKGTDYSKAWMAFAGGTGGSFLLFIVFLLLINTNIRAERLAEELTSDLREREAQLIKWAQIFENARWGITVGSADARIFELLNPAFAEMHGYRVEELMGKPITDVFAPECRKDIIPNILKAHELGHHVWESLHLRKDGTVFPVLIDVTSVKNAQGKILYRVVNVQDITERKAAEEEVIKSRREYALLVSNIPVGVYTLRSRPDGVFRFEYVSPQMARLMNMSEESLLNDPQRAFSSTLPDDLEEFVRLNSERIKQPRFFDWKGRMVINGEIKWFHISSTPELQSDGDTLWHGVISDITGSKISEEKIKTLLNEKELILKEVHHRIKNNMNIITSILQLQTETLTDQIAIEALEDSASRVRSMMVLYDKLYRSDDFKEISVMHYISQLVDDITANFPNRNLITVEKKIDDIDMDIKKIQSLGIIINEILTNIMKYAFTGRSAGCISISVNQSADQICLIIEDDGNGIPESVNFENTAGFGLMLVQLMTKQIAGNIRIERGNGTRIILEFAK